MSESSEILLISFVFRFFKFGLKKSRYFFSSKMSKFVIISSPILYFICIFAFKHVENVIIKAMNTNFFNFNIKLIAN